MTDKHSEKPNYNDSKYDHQYQSSQYSNTFGDSHLPVNYQYRSNTDDFYRDEDSSSAGSFLMGALVGGVIGAAAALFLAPKTGKEMREDFSEQAVQLKNKSIELGNTAKDKATEYSSAVKDKAEEYASAAKDKTEELSKTIQDQSGQIVDKVKSMTNKTSIPMDDGTASSEGEEATDYVAPDNEKTKDSKDQTTGNSDVAYDNSENLGHNKVMNQNDISVEHKK